MTLRRLAGLEEIVAEVGFEPLVTFVKETGRLDELTLHGEDRWARLLQIAGRLDDGDPADFDRTVRHLTHFRILTRFRTWTAFYGPLFHTGPRRHPQVNVVENMLLTETGLSE